MSSFASKDLDLLTRFGACLLLERCVDALLFRFLLVGHALRLALLEFRVPGSPFADGILRCLPSRSRMAWGHAPTTSALTFAGGGWSE
jgi:hypothetical protein